MLRELSIENLAIIEEARIAFGEGLNVLTGETGAGKSLLIAALELVLGERAKAEWIRADAEEARVEAVIDLEETPELAEILENAGHASTDTLVVRRTVARSGKNRVQEEVSVVDCCDKWWKDDPFMGPPTVTVHDRNELGRGNYLPGNRPRRIDHGTEKP